MSDFMFFFGATCGAMGMLIFIAIFHNVYEKEPGDGK